MTPNPRRPIFLEGYDALAELERWRAAGGSPDDPTLRRWWRLGPGAVDSKIFRCELEMPGTKWVLAISKLAPSPEEAVWLALEEFARTPAGGPG